MERISVVTTIVFKVGETIEIWDIVIAVSSSTRLIAVPGSIEEDNLFVLASASRLVGESAIAHRRAVMRALLLVDDSAHFNLVGICHVVEDVLRKIPYYFSCSQQVPI